MYYLVKPDGCDLEGPYKNEKAAQGMKKALGLYGWEIFEINVPEETESK